MPLPAIASTGYLPPGAHIATAEDVRVRFVEELMPSERRPMIFERWTWHRQALDELVTVKEQWLGGSFISDKPEPGDMDLCTVLEGASFEALPPHKRLMAEGLLLDKYTQELWGCDSYRIVTYPEGHLGHGQMAAAMAYWSSFWSKTRPDARGDQIERGYVVSR